MPLVEYTRDSTYLRMSKPSLCERQVAFPDGRVQVFEQLPLNVPCANRTGYDWRLTRILDSFGNKVEVSYPEITGYAAVWRVQDDQSRVQMLYFRDLAGTTYPQRVLDKVELTAFGGKTATYTLEYRLKEIERSPDDSSGLYTPGPNVTVGFLTGLVLPSEDGEAAAKYSFEVGTEPRYATMRPYTGHLRGMKLPTGGSVEWDYARFGFPTGLNGKPRRSSSTGVIARRAFDPAGNIAKWVYTHELSKKESCTHPTNPLQSSGGPRQLRSSVTSPDGVTTFHYFSIFKYDSDRCENTVGWTESDYGMPFTRYASVATADGRTMYLSSETRTGVDPALLTKEEPPTYRTSSGAPARSTYVTYERDVANGSAGEASEYDVNKRESSSRTILHDYDSASTGGVSDYSDTNRTDFDGAGHYRTLTISGRGSVAKRVTTNYSPGRTFPGASTAPWLLNLYDFVETSQGTVSGNGTYQPTSTARADFCFDSTSGFLKRQRVRRGIAANAVAPSSTDLLTEFIDANADGRVDTMRRGGGDSTPLGSFQTCDAAFSPRYEVQYEYSYGVISGAKHVGTSFKSLDLTLDLTGLPSITRDTAGVATKYVYNRRGQLTEVRPDHGAWTEYSYSLNAATMPHATVIVRQFPESILSSAGATPLTESRYYYDGSGRMVQQRSWMSTASLFPWSASSVSFDLSGRKVSATVPIGVAQGGWSTLSAPSTQWEYDALGRPRNVTQSDGSSSQTEYKGSHEVRRTVTAKVPPAGGGTPVDTLLRTVETYDVHGRLTGVIEDETGSAFSTTYGYDQSDRLVTVTSGVQSRSFTYDGAGLLTHEDHPESAPMSYHYDAAGHLWKQARTAAESLRFEYDHAERATKVWEDLDGAGTAPETIAKEFAYDRPNSAAQSDYSMGKLDFAIRHNRQPLLGGNGDVVVKETYTYAALGGRVSAKRTDVTFTDLSVKSFIDGYSYDPLGALETLTYPCWPGSACTSQRTVTNGYTAGLLTQVGPYAGRSTPIRYHANGLVHTIPHRNAGASTPNGPLYTQAIDEATGLPRPYSISVTQFCANFSVQLPDDKTITTAGEPARITAQSVGAATFQWYYGESGNVSAQVPNQTAAELTIPVTAATRFWVRVGNGSCTVDSKSVSVTVAGQCSTPNTTIATGSSMTAMTLATASVPTAAGATYNWTISNGTIVTGQGTAAITYRASCSGSIGLAVTVSTACSSSPVSGSAYVAVTAPTASVSGTQATTSSANVIIHASLTGVGPWVLQWNDGFLQNVAASEAVVQTVERSVPSSTYTHLITSATSNGCAAAVSGEAAITAASSGCTTAATVSVTTPSAYASTGGYGASAPSGGTSYLWTVQNGTITSGQGTRLLTYSAGCPGQLRVSVTVSANGCSNSGSATVAVYPPPVHLQSADEFLYEGDSTTLTLTFGATAALSGARTVHWSDGLVDYNVTADSLSRTVSPFQTTTYRAIVYDAASCRSVSQDAIVTVLVCNDPAIAISADNSVAAGGVYTASLPAVGGGYLWSVTNGVLLTDASNSSIQFRAGCTGNVEVSVTKTVHCERTAARSIPIVAPTATVAPGGSIAQGQSFNLQLTLTGSGPGTITWSDGVTQNVAEMHLAVVQRTVTPAETTTYTAQVQNAQSCGAVVSGSATVTVVPPAPIGIVATAHSSTAVAVAWTFTGNADSFVIKRNSGSGWGTVGSAGATVRTFTDATAEPNRAYLYTVFASKAATLSAQGAHDLATTVMFRNDPVGVDDVMQVAHVTELRTAVNALRVLNGNAPLSFTDPVLVEGAVILAAHIVEVRDGLNAARAALALPAVTYSLPMAAVLVDIRAAHVNEIRGGMK